MKPQDIFDVALHKRMEHPELFRPPTWSELRQVLIREDVGVVIAPLPRPAQLVQYGGKWSIIISSDTPPRQYVEYALHELGHLWLHHDTSAERWERMYTMATEDPDSPLERDAELFVKLVLGRIDIVTL